MLDADNPACQRHPLDGAASGSVASVRGASDPIMA
jgi:hypothetical protein